MANKKPKTWLKGRGYMHLTPKIDVKKRREDLTRKISNPNWVAKYAFFPLVKRYIIQRRYKKVVGKDGKTIMAHFDKVNQKSTAKERPIEYATHLDTLIYAYYAQKISEKYEAILQSDAGLNASVIAYRTIPTKDGFTNKNNIHFAKEVFEYILAKGECVAMTFDIKSFFPSLNHAHIKNMWIELWGEGEKLPPDAFNVFKAVTQYSCIYLNDLRKGIGFDEKRLAEIRKKGIEAFFESPKELREKIKNKALIVYKNKETGIPHGLPISAMLANLYLLNFDKNIVENVVKKHNALYRRYSDDIVIVCDKSNFEAIEKIVNEAIEGVKVEIAKAKTEVFFFEKEDNTLKIKRKEANDTYKENIPLIYLGFEFYGDKTLIKSANLSKYYRRMKQAVKRKFKRIKKHQEANLLTEPVIYTKSLFRLFTAVGKAAKKISLKRTVLQFDNITQTHLYKTLPTLQSRKYRGNYITYAQKADALVPLSGIRKQISRHFSILRKAIQRQKEKYNS